MSKILPSIILTLLLGMPAAAQTLSPASPFVSVGAGSLITERDGFEDTYGSIYALSLGASAGYPVTAKTHLLARVTFAEKKGTVGGYDATFTHWVFGFGVLYRDYLPADFRLDVQAGFSFNRMEDAVDLPSTEGLKGRYNHWVDQLGFFGGMGFDKTFGPGPFGGFVEGVFNYFPRTWDKPGVNQSGMFLSAGVRYYFRNQEDR